MANTKISADPTATLLAGTEIVPILQSGVNKKTTVQTIIHDMDIPVFRRTGGVIDGLLDDTGTNVAGIESVTTFTALPTATGNNRRVIYIDDLKLFYQCDGTNWNPLNGWGLYAKSQSKIRVVSPAATFTAPVASNAAGAGKIRLVGGGVHGLTNAVCTIAGNPSYIYIAAAANWPAGLYQIADVDAATNRIDIFGTFVTGMISPTISLVNTDITALSVPIHKLNETSSLQYDLVTKFTPSIGDKRIQVLLETTPFTNFLITNVATSFINRVNNGIINQGVTNVQSSMQTLGATNGFGTGTNNTVDGTVQTNVPTTLKVVFTLSTANEFIEIRSFKLFIAG